MGENDHKGMTLDRIDSMTVITNLSNCRWVIKGKFSATNRRCNRKT